MVGPEVLHGERRVHAAIKGLDMAGVALHSLNLPEHSYKITSELDFVLVLEKIILVVEVKGAQVSCAGGVWTYSDRAGHVRTSAEGPFKQADSGMYALKERIEAFLGKSWLRDVAFGWVVITPDAELPHSSFEWAPETYIGRGKFRREGGLRQGVSAAAEYWLSKQRGSRPLGSAATSQLVNCLRPELEMVPPLSVRAGHLHDLFERLTAEQLERLDMMADNPRLLCTGGAGTGKTFLAAEAARRGVAQGLRTAVVCRSHVLASFLRGRLPATINVLALGDLEKSQTGPYDLVVVDEAQDLMTFSVLDSLDRAVAGGLPEGRWIFFYDPNSQSRVHDAFDPAAEQYLASLGAARAKLTRNCRNTREIAFSTRAHTGADIGVAIAGGGPEVQFPAVLDEEAEAAFLEAKLRELRDADVADSDVTVLSARGDWETSVVRRTRSYRKGRIVPLEDAVAQRWPSERVTWSSIVDFKGLENSFICVVDLDDLGDERALELLYVALTRARAGLWVATRPSVADQLADLFKRYAPTAVDVLRRGEVERV